MDKSRNKQNVAKNTLLLYIRMGITMIVSLFTSRIILNTLGVEDYGIYNVVGGVVVLFSFLNQSLSSATQRFISFEIGRKNYDRLKSIFNISFFIYLALVIIVILLAETIGLWFLNNKMNFPINRVNAANWVFQFSILTLCVNIIRAPFNANVIANEKMSFFAYTSIVEAILKLLIVYLLTISEYDKLKTYSVLMFLVVFLVTLWYFLYNRNRYSYVRFSFQNSNASLTKEILSFSSWGVFGSIANVGFRQGINILINVFYAVSLNAAFGIANSISGMVNQFVDGFQTALRPQLVKTHASNDFKTRDDLICQSSKFSFFLIYIIGVPVILNMEFILTIWLKIVPDYAVTFSQLMIIGLMVDAISSPLWVIVFATGKIKKYQIIISSILMSNILFSYLSARLGYGPEYMLYIRIVLFSITVIVRLLFVVKLTSFKILRFVKDVLLPISLVVIISLPIPIFFFEAKNDIIDVFAKLCSFVILTILLVYFIGIKKSERNFIINIILKKIKK